MCAAAAAITNACCDGVNTPADGVGGRFLVLVKSTPVPVIRKKYTPWLIAFIVVVGLLFTFVPVILEVTYHVDVYSTNDVAGFCWLNAQCDAIMYVRWLRARLA